MIVKSPSSLELSQLNIFADEKYEEILKISHFFFLQKGQCFSL